MWLSKLDLLSCFAKCVYCIVCIIFYRAACNAGYSDENSVCLSVRLSVCLSVCLSVTRVIPDKTEERSVQVFTPYERTFVLVY